MTVRISLETLDIVEFAVPVGPPGVPPRRIHELVDCFARVTIRHALRELVAAGRVAFDGPDCGRVYWRVRCPPSACGAPDP